tara:strand:+ start:556 stop:1035 length:480 start_codon:yes stop_codon:yes gene_type:complete
MNKTIDKDYVKKIKEVRQWNDTRIVNNKPDARLSGSLVIARSVTGNCKLISFTNISNFISTLEGDKVVAFNSVLSSLSAAAAVFMTTSRPLPVVIVKNYEFFYINKVPIGYGNGNQHHYLLKNPFNGTYSHKKPITPHDLSKYITNKKMAAQYKKDFNI